MKTTRSLVLAQLARYIGRDKGIRARDLAAQLGCPERELREHISALRRDGTLIGGHPKHGYYVIEDPAEIDETCKFLRSRARHSLQLEARLRWMSFLELVGQLRLNT